MKKLKFNKKFGILAIFLVLTVITFSTSYYGSTDIGDYSDVSKFFAGDYNADIRSSHSYLYGFIHSPFVDLTNSFVFFKVTSLILLGLIIFSTYIITKKNKNVLWLALASPIIWYMAPWINPIQFASLTLLWAFYFMARYDRNDDLRNLFFSGILLGLGWAIWDTVLFFAILMGISFLFNKKLYASFVLAFAILIGLIPRLILDAYLFSFPFYTILKSFFGTFSNLSGGIYQGGYAHSLPTFYTLILVFFTIPLSFWKLYKKENFTKLKKPLVFITLSILLIMANLQYRYLLAIFPIILVLSSFTLKDNFFKTQIKIFIVLSILVTAPYILQFGGTLGENFHGTEITNFLQKPSNIFDGERKAELILEDLDKISKEYPGEVFLVGDQPDDYRKLAYLYWGNSIKEFVSIQDYNLWASGNPIIFEKRFEFTPGFNERRAIWIGGGIFKNSFEKTNYGSIEYLITMNQTQDSTCYELEKSYNALNILRKYC